MSMTEEEKVKWLKSLGKDIVWRMAEGNPAQDITSKGEHINPQPILGGLSINNGDPEDSEAPQED